MEQIWKPLPIKNLILPNRIVFPPIATESANSNNQPTEKTKTHYQKIGSSGVGLLIVEHHFIDPLGQFSPGQLSIAKDSDIPAEMDLVNLIHGQNTLCALQINHAGSNRLESMGENCLGVSNIQNPVSKKTPIEMTIKEIADVIQSFGNSALRAKKAGYDLVEIHSAHGYLSSQFLSPLTNHRKDKYGGSIRNRMRFLLEVVEEVKGQLGDDYPLMVRLGVSDNPPQMILYPDGLNLEDSLLVAKELAEQKIDILDISGGICGSRPPSVEGEAYYLPFSDYLKPRISLVTIYTAGVTKLATAEQILQIKQADLVGIGRKLLNEPDLIIKEKSK